MRESKFHFRAFFSLLTFFGFVSMALTGAVLFMVPEGRIAYWTDWMFLGLTKTAWGNAHIVSSLLFVLAGIFHTAYNGKVLMSYGKRKAGGGVRLRRELAASSVLVLFMLAGGILEFPPVDRLILFNGHCKDSWIRSRDHEPPFGHAEQVSLRVFARRQNIDLDEALKELDANNIQVKDPDDTLREIAGQNSLAPVDVYRAIKSLEPLQDDPGRPGFTSEAVEQPHAGSGIGRKSLDEVCLETGADPETARKRLASRGIEMKNGETIRQAAERYNLITLDILKLILIEETQM